MTTVSATAAAPPRAPLRRDRRKGVLGGVCAGMSEYFDLDPTLVRVAYVLVSVFTAFAGALVYIILWALIPPKD